MLRYVDPQLNVTDYVYDSLGYLTKQINPDGTSVANVYQSAFHAMVSTTDERGDVTENDYDSEGHLTETTQGYGTGEATSVYYTYLSNGQLYQIEDTNPSTGLPQVEDQYSYDSYLRQISDANGDGFTSYTTYDLNGSNT